MTVLVLRALGVGDLATAVPALRGLRSAFAGERIVVALPSWLAPLAALTGAVDAAVPLDGLDAPLPAALTGPAAFAAGRPLVGVNLHGKGPRSHRLLAACRPERMLAFACARAGFADGPVWTADEHEVHRWCRMLGWYGIACDPDDLDLHRPARPAPVARASVVHPGAKAPARRWPAERFADVAADLAATGHHVVITGSAGERDLAARVARLAGLPPEAVLAGRTGITELAALVADARVVVSGDTGIAHLATGYRTPSVVLFGPVPPAWWGPPPGRARHRVLWHPRPRPQPAEPDRPDPGLLDVTVPEVLREVRKAQAVANRGARPVTWGPAPAMPGRAGHRPAAG